MILYLIFLFISLLFFLILRNNRKLFLDSTSFIFLTCNDVGFNKPVSLKEFGRFTVNQYDYSAIDYPIPFNELYNNPRTHYLDYGINNNLSFVLTGDIPQFSTHSSDFLFVTGASSNHALGSFNCLFSIVLAMPFSSLSYIDYGLSEEEKSILFKHFVTIHLIHQKLKSDAFIAYRKYNWDNFPKWMQLFDNPEQRGGYSWKVVAIMDLLFSWKASLGWLDGGNVVRDGLSREVMATRLYGLYSPVSAGIISKWVHNKTIEFLINHQMIESFDSDDAMASGNNIYIDYRNITIRNKFVTPFMECTYTQRCISPFTSNMRNHRQDQAVLSVMISNLKIPRSANGKYQYIPALRNERGNKEWATKPILINILKNIENVYNIRITSDYVNTNNTQYTHQEYKHMSRPQDPEWP